MVTAFLLAAGLGTRLRPLTEHRAKALVPICGLPMLDHALASVRAHGHERVLVNAHHHWQQVADWAQREGVELQVELPDVLGTGGGLRAAFDRLAERVVVVNADILQDVDLTALLAACPDVGAAMALRRHEDAMRYGPVLADAEGRVVKITSVIETRPGTPGTHFTGIHALSREALVQVPEGEVCSIITAMYRPLVANDRVGSILHNGTWADIGTLETYLETNLAVAAGRLRTPADVTPCGRRIGGGSWLGTGATIEGNVERSVIGAGAVVPNDASVTECVVWDGIRVPPGRWRRAVVYDGGVFEVR